MTVSDLIAKHEGLRLFPYLDTVGKLTIGYGRNLTDVGISDDEAKVLLANDLERAQQGISEAWPPFQQLDEVREAVIVDLAFNLGVHGLLQFDTFLGLMATGNYEAAGDDLDKTKWAGQVGARAVEDIAMIKSGLWPSEGT